MAAWRRVAQPEALLGLQRAAATASLRETVTRQVTSRAAPPPWSGGSLRLLRRAPSEPALRLGLASLSRRSAARRRLAAASSASGATPAPAPAAGPAGAGGARGSPPVAPSGAANSSAAAAAAAAAGPGAPASAPASAPGPPPGVLPPSAITNKHDGGFTYGGVSQGQDPNNHMAGHGSQWYNLYNVTATVSPGPCSAPAAHAAWLCPAELVMSLGRLCVCCMGRVAEAPIWALRLRKRACYARM